MIDREYKDADYPKIRELHARSGYGYPLPTLSSEEFYSRRVIEDDRGIGMASFLRLTSEVYLISDPSWRTPAWRMEALKKLHHVSIGDAKEHGVVELFGFLPPQITDKFGRRLSRMGWSSYKGEEWKCYGLDIR